jgi:hypothetical protein
MVWVDIGVGHELLSLTPSAVQEKLAEVTDKEVTKYYAFSFNLLYVVYVLQQVYLYDVIIGLGISCVLRSHVSLMHLYVSLESVFTMMLVSSSYKSFHDYRRA